MMVGHCHSHTNYHSQHNQHHSHRHHHPHRMSSSSASASESSRDDQEHYSSTSSSGSSNGTSATGGVCSGSSNLNHPPSSSSDYSLAMSSELGERTLHRHPSTASLLDTIERRTQKTYRYGIGLVCIGATLNWLGFAQGTTSVDPFRYLGVACVLTGSFCVCLAMCRWLAKPISVSGHHVTNLEEERSNGDVHVINVAVPMFVPNIHEEYRPTKPPDYEQIVSGDEAFPPPYDEAVKLRPSEFFSTPTPSHQGSVISGGQISVLDMGGTTNCFASHYTQTPCPLSPSHHPHRPSTPAHVDLSRALLLDHQDNESYIITTTAPTPTQPIPTPRHNYLKGQGVHGGGSGEGEDPPPAYEPSPRPSISSCSSFAPLIPTPMSRYDLPPSFGVRRLFGGSSGLVASSSSSSPMDSPQGRRESNSNLPIGNLNEHLHDQVISEDEQATLSIVAPQQQQGLQQHSYVMSMPSLPLGSNNTNINGDSSNVSDSININRSF